MRPPVTKGGNDAVQAKKDLTYDLNSNRTICGRVVVFFCTSLFLVYVSS
jgi:hypothetical protein